MVLVLHYPVSPFPLLAPLLDTDPVPPALLQVRGDDRCCRITLQRRRGPGRHNARRQSPIPRLQPLLPTRGEAAAGVGAAFGGEEAQGDMAGGGAGAPQCNHSDDSYNSRLS
ncbi:hypothetical protein CFC21_015146 [Triticum aestivum]|uniref:Uncharacterized protein n=2 Tax=Triticum aestivum TaxID=4565 RepID=A0A9R1DWD5_WHEAT|nr:hypothetical protein CFC21_015146 [Triticum aestivum]